LKAIWSDQKSIGWGMRKAVCFAWSPPNSRISEHDRGKWCGDEEQHDGCEDRNGR
jgi:hypothetical protein